MLQETSYIENRCIHNMKSYSILLNVALAGHKKKCMPDQNHMFIIPYPFCLHLKLLRLMLGAAAALMMCSWVLIWECYLVMTPTVWVHHAGKNSENFQRARQNI